MSGNADEGVADGTRKSRQQRQRQQRQQPPSNLVIGLEIHCQMTSLESKLFCPCRADYRGMNPNTNICPVCMGLPGTLPRLNGAAVRKGLMIAAALGCTIPEKIAFFRKNYFYPDLPKNFQITQLNMYGDASMGGRGAVSVGDRTIRIRRVQLEEDPGRMVYEGASTGNRTSMADYNRAGTPLVEIVTEPDFESPRHVRLFLQMLADMMENLGVCDPALEGSMRADANVSLKGGSRVEIKNINSFHDLEKAVIFEAARQEAQGAHGMSILQETRHWDAGRKITIPARRKEDEEDYRYLLEADIPWVAIDRRTLDSLSEQMPEGVGEKRTRYVDVYGIPPQVADVLSSDKSYSDLFEAAHTDTNARELASIIANDLMGMAGGLQEGRSEGGRDEWGRGGKKADGIIRPEHLRDLADAVVSGLLSRNTAKQVLYKMVRTGRSFADVSSAMKVDRISDASDLEEVVTQVILEEPEAVRQAASNPNTINYLVGKVMQKTRGRADPQITIKILQKRVAD